jgi:predicted negative regulator of RcsB-dependent stress response
LLLGYFILILASFKQLEDYHHNGFGLEMLKPRKKITKKQLKEDKLVTFYFQASEWLEKYSKYLLLGIAAIALVVAGVAYYGFSQTKAEKSASVDLARATRTLEALDYKSAISQLSAIVDSYGSTTSGKLARLHLANAFFQTKEYANAEKSYRKFISGFSGDEHFRAAAQGGVAACLEQEKKYAEAAEAYLDAAESYDSVLAPGFLVSAGRCYSLAGNDAKAKELYNRVVQDYPKAPEKDDALMLLSMIGG